MLRMDTLKSLSLLTLVLTFGIAFSIMGCAQTDTKSTASELLMTIKWPSTGTEQTEPDKTESVKVFRNNYEKVRKEFTQRLRFENEDQKKEALKNPMISAQIEQMTLNKLIFLALVKHDAEKESITVSNDEIKSFKAEHLKNIGGETAFQKILEAEHMTEAQFDQDLKDELLIKKFVESRANFQPVREAEAKQWYNANPQFFDLKERIKASHILLKFIESNVQKAKEKEAKENLWAKALETLRQEVKVDAEEIQTQVENQRKQVQAKAEKLLAELQEGKIAFDETARKHSEDYVSAVFGGDLDYLYQATTDPGFWDAAIAVSKGKKPEKTKLPFLIKEPVKSVFGYHIIRVDDYQKAGIQLFTEAKKDIIELLEQQRKQQLLLNWVNNKRKLVNIEFEDAYEKKDLFKGAFGKDKPQLSPEHIGIVRQPAGAKAPKEKPYQDKGKG